MTEIKTELANMEERDDAVRYENRPMKVSKRLVEQYAIDSGARTP